MFCYLNINKSFEEVIEPARVKVLIYIKNFCYCFFFLVGCVYYLFRLLLNEGRNQQSNIKATWKDVIQIPKRTKMMIIRVKLWLTLSPPLNHPVVLGCHSGHSLLQKDVLPLWSPLHPCPQSLVNLRSRRMWVFNLSSQLFHSYGSKPSFCVKLDVSCCVLVCL